MDNVTFISIYFLAALSWAIFWGIQLTARAVLVLLPTR